MAGFHPFQLSEQEMALGYQRRMESCFQAIGPEQQEAFFASLEVFQSPQCFKNEDCFIFDWRDHFRRVTELPPNHQLETWIDNELSKKKVVDGFNELLWALGVNQWVMDDKIALLSDGGAKVVQLHLASAYRLFQSAGLRYDLATIDDDLTVIGARLLNGELRRIGDADTAIRGLILGYALALKDLGDVVIDWKLVKKTFQEIKEDPVPPPSPPVEPPPLPIIPEEEKKEEPRKTPPPSPPPPQKEASPERKKYLELKEVAEATGGTVQDALDPAEGLEAIKRKITTEKPVEHFQIMFNVDASGSMTDDVEALRENTEALMAHARKQVQEKGEVTFGIHYYVDETSQTPVPLDTKYMMMGRMDEGERYIEREVEEAREGLEKAIDHINSIGGGLEYHWREAVRVMEEEPFSEDPSIEKILFILTDEAGDIGDDGWSKEKVIQKAKELGIRIEVIRFLTAEPAMTVPQAMEILSTPSWSGKTEREKRESAIEVLAKSGSDKVVPYLLKAIDADERYPSVREKAAEAIRNFDDPGAIPVLVRAIDPSTETNADVRGEAETSLLQLADEPAIQSILHDFEKKENPRPIRLRALNALRLLAKTKHIPALLPWVTPTQEKDPEIRKGVLQVLGSKGDKSAIPAILQAMDPKTELDFTVRNTAIDTLRQVNKERWNPPLSEAEFSALKISLNPEMEPSPANRANAAHLIVDCGWQSLPALLQSTRKEQETNATVRQAAVNAVTNLVWHYPSLIQKDKTLLSGLLERLDPKKEPAIEVRAEVFTPLSYFPRVHPADEKTIAALTLSLDPKYEESEEIRQRAAEQRGVPPTVLLRSLNREFEPSEKVRKRVAEQLKNSNHPEVLPALLKSLNPALEPDESVRETLVQSIPVEQLKEKDLVILIHYLDPEQKQNASTRRAIIATLNSFKDKISFLRPEIQTAEAALLRSTDPAFEPDPETRGSALMSLPYSKKNPDHLAALQRATDPKIEKDMTVQQLAKRLLAEQKGESR